MLLRPSASTLLAPILVSPFKAFLVRMRCPLLSAEFEFGFSCWWIGFLIRLSHFNWKLSTAARGLFKGNRSGVRGNVFAFAFFLLPLHG